MGLWLRNMSGAHLVRIRSRIRMRDKEISQRTFAFPE